ncbi:MAG: AsmA family protein [Pelomonas sp.]|nr:AsmA family protein [Roseateles sp.]
MDPAPQAEERSDGPPAAPPRRRGLVVTAGLLGGLAVLGAAVGGADLAGWPGLAPRALAHFAPTLGLTLAPDTRVHLLYRPRLLAPTLTLAHDGQTLADAQGLELRWDWRDVWRWQREGAPLRVRAVQAARLELHWARDAAGRSNWQFLEPPPAAASAAASAAPTPLPVIDNLSLATGSASVDDAPLHLKADAQFSSAADGHWQARVDGQLNGQQLALQAQAGQSLALLSDAPMPPIAVQASLSHGRSRVSFDGTAASLLDAQALDGRVDASGPSLADAGRPLGLTLPATPPFALHGRLRHAGTRWFLAGTDARVGGSRLGGDFQFDTAPARPLLSGALRGGPLRLVDLGPAVGADAPPSRSGRVLPDRPFDLPALNRMDAALDIRLSSLDLDSRALEPLAPVGAKLELRDGRLALNALQIGVAGGQLSGTTTLDAQVDPPQWQANLAVQGLVLDRWLREHSKAFGGTLQGLAVVQGQGRSTAALLGSLDGGVVVTLRHGHMSHLATELAGLDLARALVVWLRGDDAMPLGCAKLAGRFDAGVLTPHFAVLDNADNRIELGGKVDLAHEQLALRVVTLPKDFSPVALRTPIRVEGSFADPHVALEGKPLGVRALGAIALGVITPPAALVALFDRAEKTESLSCSDPLPLPPAKTAAGVPASAAAASAPSYTPTRSAPARRANQAS